MVVEEHMVCVALNRICCATYWFNPNILLHEKHYRLHISPKRNSNTPMSWQTCNRIWDKLQLCRIVSHVWM